MFSKILIISLCDVNFNLRHGSFINYIEINERRKSPPFVACFNYCQLQKTYSLNFITSTGQLSAASLI